MKDMNKTKKELIAELEELRNKTNVRSGAKESEHDDAQQGSNTKNKRYDEIISTVTKSVHSSMDLEEVLENAVESMNRHIEGVDNVSIYFIEGDDATIKAWRGYPEWFIKSVERIPRPKGFTWKVLGEGEQIYCADVDKDKVIGKLGRDIGTKSYASMPIKRGEETIGCININSLKKNSFDSEDLKLLDIIAGQIAVAIDNARQTEALRESEERYRTLYDQSPIGVYIFDKNLVITNTNDYHANTLKITREKIIGTKLRELNDKTFLGLHEDALSGKSGTQEGYYKATASPVELWLHLSIAPLRNGAGNITGGMAVVDDITERKKAEIALSQSEEEYESLVNTVEGIVWEAEPETLAFTFVSKQAERILGYPSNSWVEDETLWMSRLHPEDRHWVPSYCRECVDRNQNHTMEYRMHAADGRVVWLRDIVTVVITDGKVTGLRGLMVDITEHKNAEDLLKESADRYRALVEKIQDLVVEASADGKFLYVSPNFKEVLGYDAEDLVGINIFKHVHPDDQEATFKEFLRIITLQTSGKAVFRFRNKEGRWSWFDATGKTYKTAEGEIRCVIVSRDVTERKKLEEEMFKKENLESLGVLAGGIAHDFNNLLTSILGNVSISKMNISPNDKIYKRLSEAESASLRAKDLTSQLLTFSRGGAPVKEYVQSLGDLIRDTANFVVSGSKVKCEYEFADKVWPAEIDEGQISQVIHNLILNADQAMPEGGKINIRLENICHNGSGNQDSGEERFIKLTIEDSGIGMTEELKKKIFDPYFTTKQRGSGLGLTTVYSIIKNHDGYINVTTDIGVGTIFEVLIPAAEYSNELAATDPDVFRGEGKILIMDDEETVRAVAGEMVTYLGYEVEYAADGEQAIEKYVSAMESGSPYDAVMIDLTIPGGMGGKEANRKLHDIDPFVKTIVSSGYFNDPVMSEFSNYGFKGVITKPYKIEELSRTLHSVLNGSPH